MRDRVLVVDDNRDAADSLARLVEQFGCEAQAVYDGNQAIAQVPSFLPDMALIDIAMPGLDGCETASRIRQQRGGLHVILVAVTGWTRAEAKRRAYDCGFDLYVVKPMSVATVKDLLALLNPAIKEQQRAGRPQPSSALFELDEMAEPKKRNSHSPGPRKVQGSTAWSRKGLERAGKDSPTTEVPR